MVSEQRKAELTAQGFYIEDIGQEYGSDFAGEYRWINRSTSDFQDYDVSYSEEDAWLEADRFARNVSSSYATKE